jgi:protein TonB
MKRERIHLSGTASADEARGRGDDSIDGSIGNSIIDLLGKSFEERPIWAGLYEELRDVLFPQKLPPLELTSTPVQAPDRMDARTNPWAVGTATVANGGLLAILILLGLSSSMRHLPQPAPGSNIHLKDFTLFVPAGTQAGHGGSGGANELTEPIVGRAPRQEVMPIVAPQTPLLDRPRLAIDAAIAVPPEVKLPDNASLPNIGVQKSPNVTLDSHGPGSGLGIGTRTGGGDGPGKGPGYGPGSGPGLGNSIYRPGTGGVTNPVPLVSPEAEFSDEARRQKYQGVCMISIIVDARGYPQNPRVTRSLGMGLDEKALEAVGKYRFKPAMKDGKPVAAFITVEVNFRLY